MPAPLAVIKPHNPQEIPGGVKCEQPEHLNTNRPSIQPSTGRGNGGQIDSVSSQPIAVTVNPADEVLGNSTGATNFINPLLCEDAEEAATTETDTTALDTERHPLQCSDEVQVPSRGGGGVEGVRVREWEGEEVGEEEWVHLSTSPLSNKL